MTTATSTHTSVLPPIDFFLLAAIWGASYLFMRLATEALAPFVLAEVRLLLGACLLLPLCYRHILPLPIQMWGRIALVSVFNMAGPAMLFSWAAHQIPSGVNAIAGAMTVVFTSLIGVAVFRERLHWRAALGILGGLLSVTLLARSKLGDVTLGWPVLGGVVASLCYGIGLHLAKRLLVGVPAMALAAAAMICSALMILPFTLGQWPRQVPPMHATLSTILLGLLCTGFAYVLYYRLVARIGPARTSAVSYLIPVFGVTFGALFLHETVTMAMGLSGLLILVSIGLCQSGNSPQRAGSAGIAGPPAPTTQRADCTR
ncbi:EamA family transporter [Ahniella affigens]|uniref:EamA family transporter n=1 Tax=Ahniella affigens TaxID=2021234 RepID=A0A2P1PY15_9GAMM|nr:DMT family transporter [Ahniella affigens]AVP99723.1 EamA family transporter [Ahniella affigens]